MPYYAHFIRTDRAEARVDRMTKESKLDQLIASRRPGFTLPQAFYTDEDVFEADLERVYFPRWLLAGHTSQVANPGDYFVFNLGRESLIVIRGDNGQLQALFNTCRHRGSRICLDSQGHVGKLVCPYHQWAYERDGRLAGARSMGADFDKSRYPLHRAHVRVAEGLVYVCLADSPPEFNEAHEVLSRFLRPHGLDRTKICFSQDYVVHANWKLLFENNRECYHCAVGHPEFCKTNYDLGMPGDQRTNAEYDAVMDRMRRHWETNGLAVGPVNFPNGSWYRCARVPLREGYVTESLDGQPLAPVMGDLKIRDAGSLRVITFPNAWCHVNSDNANLTQLLPMGPRLTHARITWLVRDDAVEGEDYDPRRVVELWKITTEQDWKLCESNQLGINSSRYEPGPLSTVTEHGVDFFTSWYLVQLSATNPALKAKFPDLTRTLTI